MYLVTGSAGHLGEALMRLGRARGLAMRGLDRAASDWTDIVGDITDAACVARVMDGVAAVLHTATLHKPHVATHSRQDFIDTNITGTLTLLEAASDAGVGAFVFTSTTSAFGAALTPGPGEPAVWIDESVAPVAKNIYGATKTAAEDLCRLFATRFGLPCIVLRTSRFFPEPDDDPMRRAAYADQNAKANEFLFRRVEIGDAAEAHFLAAAAAPRLGFDRFVISAPTPFSRALLADLRARPHDLVADLFQDMPAIYAKLGWRMFDTIDRVYDCSRAIDRLGWRPAWNFARVLERAAAGDPVLGPLALEIGIKGYHGADYADGIYPVGPAAGRSTTKA